MDIFPDIEQAMPLPHEKVLRLAGMQICYEYKKDWLMYRCKEEGVFDIYQDYKSRGIFDALQGEVSKSFYPPRLTIELVPKSCWFDNVRNRVSTEDWQKLKRITSNHAQYRCEICGGRGSKWAVECHEVWDYDDIKLTQTLSRLIALCPSCHEVKHIGLAQLRGKQFETTAHLALINGWSYLGASDYVEHAFEVWAERSQKEWKLDISYLNHIGITVHES
ncbi:hypothetical protein P3735_22025 [Vibrio parahaemolyticus]|nr:hypothetical protein [Vibrio parahaemolyticus]